jgi:hypothetical protein
MKLNINLRWLNLKTQYNNWRFEMASPGGKRVIIAKDVLKQLDAGRYGASVGAYVRIPIYNNGFYADKADDIQSNFNKVKTCSVCAIGSCLMSITHFKNKLKFRDVIFQSSLHGEAKELMSKYFTPRQLSMIEIAFEKRYSSGFSNYARGAFGYIPSQDEIDASLLFGSKIYSDTKRLRAIMQNIITNKGEFIPTK